MSRSTDSSEVEIKLHIHKNGQYHCKFRQNVLVIHHGDDINVKHFIKARASFQE